VDAEVTTTENLLAKFDAERGKGPRAAAVLLRGWLEDDAQRAALYAQLQAAGRAALRFDSVEGTAAGEPAQPVHLLVRRDDIVAALKHGSVSPYAALGGGRFMLAIDDRELHDAQREFVARHLRYDGALLADCAAEAWRRASILPLKQPRFGLPELAEQTALRFVEQLFGLPETVFPILALTVARAYLELSFQIIGRHFDDQLDPRPPLPADIKDLQTRMRELFEDPPPADKAPLWSRERLAGNTVVERCRDQPGGHPADMLATILTGLLAGTVGNVQAAATIAIDDFFNDGGAIDEARRAARDDRDDELWSHVCEALTRKPPAAFLARAARAPIRLDDAGAPMVVPAGGELLLGIGAAGLPQLVFGGASGDRDYMHQCVGEHLAKPLVLQIVKQVLLLPGLAQSFDTDDGRVRRPKKRWGVICSDYPLLHDSRRRLSKWPLMVVMRIKPPVAENAARIVRLIAAGAPTIEDALARSHHVHAAWFGLVSGGTELALFTVYDGDFDAYVQYFAAEVELFDSLFEFIDDAPPTPVRQNQKEFIERIRRYNRAPLGNYFFSAYPPVTVADIRNRLRSGEAK